MLTIFIPYLFIKDFVRHPVVNDVYDILIGLVAGILTFYLSVFISRSIKKYITKNRENHSSKSMIKSILNSTSFPRALLLVLASIIVYSIVEEILFRSILLNFIALRLGNIYAILVSSFIYAILHLNNKIIQLFIMGCCFSLLLIYTGNLLTPIIAHITNNTLVLMVHIYKNIKGNK